MSSTTDLPSESPAQPSADHWIVWREYFRAGRELTTALDRRLQADAGISHPELLVLVALSRSPGTQLRTGELAAGLNWEKSRVSHQVSRMVKRGFVTRRECSDDARGVWVSITPEGARVLDEASVDHGAALTEWFLDVLTPDELAVVEEVSRRLREKLVNAGVAPSFRIGVPASELPPETEASDSAAS